MKLTFGAVLLVSSLFSAIAFGQAGPKQAFPEIKVVDFSCSQPGAVFWCSSRAIIVARYNMVYECWAQTYVDVPPGNPPPPASTIECVFKYRPTAGVKDNFAWDVATLQRPVNTAPPAVTAFYHLWSIEQNNNPSKKFVTVCMFGKMDQLAPTPSFRRCVNFGIDYPENEPPAEPR